MATKSAAFHKARKALAEDPKIQKAQDASYRANIAKLERANKREELKANAAKNVNKKDTFFSKLSNIFTRKSKSTTMGGKKQKHRKTKRRNKKCSIFPK